MAGAKRQNSVGKQASLVPLARLAPNRSPYPLAPGRLIVHIIGAERGPCSLAGEEVGWG